jgi:hypothetical protein
VVGFAVATNSLKRGELASLKKLLKLSNPRGHVRLKLESPLRDLPNQWVRLLTETYMTLDPDILLHNQHPPSTSWIHISSCSCSCAWFP